MPLKKIHVAKTIYIASKMFPKFSPMFPIPHKNNILRNIIPVPVPQNTFQEHMLPFLFLKQLFRNNVPVHVPLEEHGEHGEYGNMFPAIWGTCHTV